jgi:serine/threonine protein phosphatase PrpC
LYCRATACGSLPDCLPAFLPQLLYVAHAGDSGAVMVCSSFDLHFPLRLTADHKPNRPDEHARIAGMGGDIDEERNRVVSAPKPHNNRVTMLSMSRWVCL